MLLLTYALDTFRARSCTTIKIVQINCRLVPVPAKLAQNDFSIHLTYLGSQLGLLHDLDTSLLSVYNKDKKKK